VDPLSVERPPAYDDADGELWPPTILVLVGQSIHAESAKSAPLYQLNRGVDVLTQATHQVELERVERTVSTSAGEPSIKPRTRHIYNLKCMRNAPGGLGSLPSDSPHYHIQAVSRRTGGNVGLKKSRFHSKWAALPVNVSSKNSSHRLPHFLKDAQSLFEIQLKNDKYEWTYGNGNALAVEDEGEDLHRLIVCASLSQASMDTLVALWCCRLWQYSSDHAERVHPGLEGGTSSILCIEPLIHR
jgi:hypothetical protein